MIALLTANAKMAVPYVATCKTFGTDFTIKLHVTRDMLVARHTPFHFRRLEDPTGSNNGLFVEPFYKLATVLNTFERFVIPNPTLSLLYFRPRNHRPVASQRQGGDRRGARGVSFHRAANTL